MPTFNVELERNGRRYRIAVDAADQGTAETAALKEISGPKYMSREEREAKIAALEQEQQQVEGQGSSFFNEVVVPTVVSVGTAAGNTINEAGQAVADLAAAAPESSPVGSAGRSVGDWLRKNKAEREALALGVTVDAFEQAWGRPVTDDERKELERATVKNIDRAQIGTDILAAIAPAGLAAKAATLPRALALGTGEGALSAFLLSDSDAETIAERNSERLKQASVGAVFGGLANGVFVGLPAAFKNSFARYVNKEIKRAGGIQAYREAAEDAGGMLTVGQFTGNPRILQAEARAAGSRAQALVARQKEDLVRNFANRLGEDLPSLGELGRGQARRISSYERALRQMIGRSRGRVNSAFRSRLKAAERIYDGPALVLDDMADDLTRVIQEAQAGPGTKAMTAEARKMITDMARATKDGASVKQLNRWMVKLNEVMGDMGSGIYKVPEGAARETAEGVAKQGYGLARQLADGLKRNVMAAAADNTPKGQALKIMQNARRIYGDRKNALATLESEMLTALGVGRASADDIVRKLGQADLDELELAVKLLDGIEGGAFVKGQLRDAIIHGVAKASVSGSARSQALAQGAVAMDDFAQALGRTSEKAVTAGLLTKKQQMISDRVLQSARRIMNSEIAKNGVVPNVAQVDLSSVAINVVSRSPEFMARLLAQAIQEGKGIEWLFFSPAGQKAMTSLEKVIVGGNMSKSALEAANLAAYSIMDTLAESAYDKTLEQQEQKAPE